MNTLKPSKNHNSAVQGLESPKLGIGAIYDLKILNRGACFINDFSI